MSRWGNNGAPAGGWSSHSWKHTEELSLHWPSDPPDGDLEHRGTFLAWGGGSLITSGGGVGVESGVGRCKKSAASRVVAFIVQYEQQLH